MKMIPKKKISFPGLSLSFRVEGGNATSRQGNQTLLEFSFGSIYILFSL